MVKYMKNLKNPLISNRSGASYTISAVIITATTVALVLIAATYAYQILDQQRGTSEFNMATNSLVTFDDAVRDIAWSLKGMRNTRFAVDYGQLTLIPDDTEHGLDLIVDVEIDGTTNNLYSDKTGYIEYSIPQQYVTFGERKPFYILGDNQTVVTQGTEDLGRLLIAHESGWVSASLTYRVRAMEASTITLDDETLSYVNIWLVKMQVSDYSSYIGELDLTAKANYVYTISSNEYYPSDGQCMVHVQLGNERSEKTVTLGGSAVVFNLIISEVEVIP